MLRLVSVVSLYFPHVVDVSALSICIVLRVFIVVLSMCTGQVGLVVGSWPSNLTNVGSPLSKFDYTS